MKLLQAMKNVADGVFFTSMQKTKFVSRRDRQKTNSDKFQRDTDLAIKSTGKHHRAQLLKKWGVQ